MDISVIIPCYNSFDALCRCLYSLECQKKKEFEVIIIDDSSTDGTYEKIKKNRAEYNLKIKIGKTDKNSGPGVARNIGIEMAEGEFLAFCDCDDTYEPEYLDEMYKRAMADNADIVMCNYRHIYENGQKKEINYTKIFNESEDPNKYIIYSKASFCLLLIRKALFENIKIPAIYQGEDMATIPILLSKAQMITHTDKILYNYYVHNGSTSNSNYFNAYNSLQKVYSAIENNCGKMSQDILEFWGIKIFLYGSLLNGMKAKVPIKEINKVYCNFGKKYPNWGKNRYIKDMDFRYRLFLFLLEKNIYIGCYLFAQVHKYKTEGR